MNNIKKIGLLFLLIIGLSKFGLATHLTGGDITYVHVSTNYAANGVTPIDYVYDVEFNHYTECNPGAGNSTDAIFWQNNLNLSNYYLEDLLMADPNNRAFIKNSSGYYPANYTSNATSYGNLGSLLKLISFNVIPNQCACNIGAGNIKATFKGQITLPADNWTFSVSLVNRSNMVALYNGSIQRFYVETNLRGDIFPKNSSAQFTSDLGVTTAAGIPFNYDYGGSVASGHSLSYTYIAPKQSSSIGVGYTLGYSPATPLGAVISTTNDWNPTNSGSSFSGIAGGPKDIVIAVLVEDHLIIQGADVVVGSVLRDMQMIFVPSTNINPSLSNIIQNNVNTAMTNITAPAQSQLCFDVSGLDPNTSQNINLSSNGISTIIPGVIFNVSNNNTINPIANICWTPSLTDVGNTYCFTVIAQDNACSIGGVPDGITYQTYCITVVPDICPQPSIEVSGECTSAPVVFDLNSSISLFGAAITWDFGDGTTGTGISASHTYTSPNTYTVTASVIGPSTCSYTVQEDVTVNCCFCRTSFAPTPGVKYVLSAWVKETQPPVAGTQVEQQVENYIGPEVYLDFFDDAGAALPIGGPYWGPYVGSNSIIEGWQRIEQVFVVPLDALTMQVRLNNGGSNDVYFDDVRIHPFNSSMKSYVYDPVSLRLWSELDENNYATFYEYDEQGNLTRIKKETERGIVTIQESREGQYKEEKDF